MDRHVFISYRRSDSSVVDELVTALSGRFTCWRDTARISGGQVWREEITRALDVAYAMILAVSPETEQSKEVYAEYFYALGRKVPVIPLLITQCQLPFGLENVNARAWHKDKQLAVKELHGDLDLYNRRAPALEPTNDIHTYLNALQLGYLMNVGNYTPMASAWSAAVPGAANRCSCVHLSGTGSTPATATPTSAFVLPRTLVNPLFFFLLPFGGPGGFAPW